MDEKVLDTQKWINKTYGNVPSFDNAPENGETGWPTITSLIEALQYELKIPNLTGEFGPATLAACPTLSMNTSAKASNIVKILQGSMWCKGYDCDDLSGIFGVRTHAGIMQLQKDIGITNNGVVTPHIFKSLLNMDAFVLVTNNSFIREFQQHFNRNYVEHNDGNYIPCDGRSGREFTAAVTYVVQALEGFSPAVSTGFFGDTTASKFPKLSNGSSSEFVYPLQAALSANRKTVGGKSNVITNTIVQSIKEFQSFMALPIDGIANGNLMKNLLISTGDALRDVDGCDSAMPIDTDRLNSLIYYNYHYVGRYITPGQFSWGNKQLTVKEINLILNGGLRIFPIFQTSADYAAYFTYEQGYNDGELAIQYAKSLNIPRGTIIYFAVDYDFMDGELNSTVIPYFQAINNKFYGNSNNNDNRYRIGVYSSRNTCSRVGNLASASFVSGMSTGYSGNLGFPMPDNWSFNQILGVNFLSIDNDAVSGLDKGFGKNEYDSESSVTDSINSSYLNQLKTVYDLAYAYTKGNTEKSNKLTAMYFRHKKYTGSTWKITAGDIDETFCNLVNEKLNYHSIIEFYDPIL